MEALTIGLRQELLPFGVQVVAVAPTDINTRFN
ncbi:MAG: short-chain dehydrogenase/reductase, partial [Firmicutes bacterium]|nr:short-chain dehydrogenase/reductase [Bacillota bacterium]